MYHESVLDHQQATNLCAYWQKILRIQDWHVEVRIIRAVEFHLAESAGEVHTFGLKRRAIIHLLHQDDWKLGNKGIFARPPDHEYTLIHELLHIVMHDVTPAYEKDSPKYDAEERAIYQLACALLELHRSAPRAIGHVPLDVPVQAALPLDLQPQRPHLVVTNPSPLSQFPPEGTPQS
jgi:hypothetical protein